jgi:hypothetical protein
MLCLVATLALAAGVEAVVEPSPQPFEPRAVLYGYPSSAIAMDVFANTRDDAAIYGALGASMRLGGRVALDVEVAGGTLTANVTQGVGWLLSAGVGPSMQLTSDEPFRGLFVTTRFRVEAFNPPPLPPIVGPNGNHGPFNVGAGVARAFLAEVDVGYHLRLGRFYFAPIIGIGAGYAYDYIDSTGVGFLSPFTAPSNPGMRPQAFVWTLNLNLARVGVAL